MLEHRMAGFCGDQAGDVAATARRSGSFGHPGDRPQGIAGPPELRKRPGVQLTGRVSVTSRGSLAWLWLLLQTSAILGGWRA